MLSNYKLFNQPLTSLGAGRILINTLNAHCYNVAQTDLVYQEALQNSDVLLPDGVSVVWGLSWLSGQSLQKIAGADLFYYEMNRLQNSGETSHALSVQHSNPRAFFLGSTEAVLSKIKERAKREYPNITVQTYSPPYKAEFSAEDNAAMLELINAFQPDVLMVGMTAPKQEKWAYKIVQSGQLKVENCHICCIGAVFDFYAGTVKRAPKLFINMGLEWFYRLLSEPNRMWRRYLVGNVKFVWYVLREKFNNK